MSEEEIINYLSKEIINNDIALWQWFEDLEYDEETQLKQAVQGLLNLYNKEKEKNKTLEDLLQGNLYEIYKYYKEVASKYQANSVSKDTIREKIQRLESIEPSDDDYNFEMQNDIHSKINILQELLEGDK